MFKQLVFAAIIASPVFAMDFESRRKETDVVPGVPQAAAIAYLNALTDFKEIDPQTEEVFPWSDAIDYEFFRDGDEKADTFTRYKHALIYTAHINQISAKDLVKAQQLLNQSSTTLFYVRYKGMGMLEPAKWAQYWAQLKREITAHTEKMDAKCSEFDTEN